MILNFSSLLYDGWGWFFSSLVAPLFLSSSLWTWLEYVRWWSHFCQSIGSSRQNPTWMSLRTTRVGVSSDLDQLNRPLKPTRTEGPWVALNPIYDRSRVGKWKNRIIPFRFGFQNISPEKPKPIELFIYKKILYRIWHQYITCQE